MKLDITKIPQDLHYLILYVEICGIESLDDQDTFVTEMQMQSPQEIQECSAFVDKALPLIAQWRAALIELKKSASELTEEDWKHPYWSFLNMLKLREITGYDDNDPDVAVVNQRFGQELRLEQYDETTVRTNYTRPP